MEFSIGALAAVGAGFFTNPLEVVKTRMQLQGELKKKGHYAVHYRNFLHAFYVVGKTEGIWALQKGLKASLFHQVILNGIRLGCYQVAEEKKIFLNSEGKISTLRIAGVGAIVGIAGAFFGSPLYLVKTRLQAQSANSIAVGHQHEANGVMSCLMTAYKEGGIVGLWRGAGGSLPRMMVGSSCQLTSFYIVKEYLADNKYYIIKPGLLSSFVASMIGGVAVAIAMGPLDVVSTRLYNQGVGTDGKGLLYSGYMDCTRKMWKSEGLTGFYKGVVACYMRIGPHTVLCLMFWEQLRQLQRTLSGEPEVKLTSTS